MEGAEHEAEENDEVEGAEHDEAKDNTDQPELWLRGPANLPDLPATDHDKPVIEPHGDTQWKELGGGKRRNPNGVIGVLLKEFFPGLVTYNGRTEPPWTWKHYEVAEDFPDEDGVQYNNRLARVEETFWDYFRWATNPEDSEAEKQKKEQDARRVVRNVIKKRVKDMYYEARIAAVVFYYARVHREKLTRKEACTKRLSEREYMEAIPPWAATFEDCLLQIVRQTWCNRDWLENSDNCRDGRLLMTGPGHRQGSSSFQRYKKIQEVKHKRPMSDMAVYVAARRGPADGVLCNDRAKEVVEAYTDAAKEIHGQDFDVMNEPLDPGVVYKAGLGKKHCCHLMGNGFIDSRASLSQGRCRSSASSDEVRPSKRARTSTDRIGELEAKLEQMHQLLLSLQGNLNGNPAGGSNPVTPLSTPGTQGSIGNAGASNVDGREGMGSPQAIM